MGEINYRLLLEAKINELQELFREAVGCGAVKGSMSESVVYGETRGEDGKFPPEMYSVTIEYDLEQGGLGT